MTINLQTLENLVSNFQDIITNYNDQATDTLDPLAFAITVFMLSCFVGYYVIWKVTPSLHTPLMSVTNAISGIIIIGAMLVVGPEYLTTSSFLGLIAVFLASINIFGGFTVTARMLKMFKKK
jgi:NAD(P) transhydrogenase subunit alpha